MKKRILGILTVMLALSMVFTVASCGDKGGGKPATVTITLEVEQGVTLTTVLPGPFTINRDTALGDRLPTTLVRTDAAGASKIFDGWVVKGKTTKVDGTYKFGSNHTLMATWRDRDASKILITFEDGYSSPAVKIGEVEIEPNSKLTQAQFPSPLPTRATHDFDAWIIKDSSTVVDTDYTFTAAATVVIAWKLKSTSGTPVTISYNANGWTGGGVPTSTRQGTTGQVLGLANYPTLESTATQIFGGWAISSTGNGQGTAVGANYSIPANTTTLTLYVVWTERVAAGQPITITYHANGWEGSGVPTTPGTGTSGALLPPDALPTLQDTARQQFIGWSLEEAGAAIDTATYQPESHINVYVLWTPIAQRVTITFDLNYPGAPAPTTREVIEDTEIGNLPVPLSRDGFVFSGWWNTSEASGGNRYDASSRFVINTTMYARWIPDVLTAGDDADELLYLTNGGYAFYQFDIPAGKTLADYESLSVDFKISAAGLAAWGDHGIRGVRLYGVFDGTETVSTDSNPDYGLPDVKYVNLNASENNAPYILSNPAAGNAGSTDETVIIKRVTADEWFNVTHPFTGQRHADYVADHEPGVQTGAVYFALGIACQTVSYVSGDFRAATFIQLVKDIKLVAKDGGEDLATSGKPGDDFAQFLCMKDPIVFEWRAEATTANIANWKSLVPAVPEDLFDRGDPPADADLVEAVLGTPGFTYINRGNPNNQRGWASFGEAGQANDNDYSGDASTIPFANFKNAWYLVLETTSLPTGQVNLIWSGDAGSWSGNNLVIDNDGAIEGISEITDKEGGGHIIKLLLPKSLAQYGTYFNDNEAWAALILGYWGDSGHNIDGLGITKAYLLVHKDEVEQPVTAGMSLQLSFTLGTTAPAGGALIDDVAIEGSNLVVTTVSGLTGFRWDVNGAANAETTGTLTIPAVSGTISLQAQKDGKWVSQAVYITVGTRE